MDYLNRASKQWYESNRRIVPTYGIVFLKIVTLKEIQLLLYFEL